MDSKILATGIAVPEHFADTETVLKHIKHWLKDQDDETQQKILKMFNSAGISRRYSIMDIEQVFGESTFEERNSIYVEKGIELCEKAFLTALEKAQLKPDEIDYLIVTSSTGIMIPSLDVHLINRLNMRTDTRRLPVSQLACGGGVSGILYAHDILKGNPDKKIAFIAYESATASMQTNERSISHLVGSVLFGDGAACVILGQTNKVRPKIVDTQMYQFKNEESLMRYNMTSTGLKINLDAQIPAKIEEHFPRIVPPFLKKNDVGLRDINHFILHPAGMKILKNFEAGFLKQFDKNIDTVKEVLNSYGNMSSPSVLYVLNCFMEKDIQKGEHGLMMAFGPGFTATTALLKWE